MRVGAGLTSILRRFALSRRGGMGVMFAIGLPALGALACGAVDLASVSTDRNTMQQVADFAALDGAKQLLVANVQGVPAREQQFALSQLSDVSQRVALTFDITTAPDNSSITVGIHGHRSSYFGNLLPYGGWSFNTSATAAPMGRTPLCVLTTSASGASGGGAVSLTDQSQITATGCLVHSNSDMAAPSPASLVAGTAEASGSASGAITPTAQTGAATISDPFASLNFNIPGLCNVLDLTQLLGLVLPGNHCANIVVGNGQSMTLLPGVHYFSGGGTLILKDNAKLLGQNVVLIFDDKSNFKFQDSSQIDLQGIQSGPYAGLVIATTRTNTNTFEISTNSARTLLGTVYVPNALLSVSGGQTNVADQSAWTVVIAKGLQLSGSPNLVINHNYAGSSVPVPSGVQTAATAVRLVR